SWYLGSCAKFFLWDIGKLIAPAGLSLEHSLAPAAGAWSAAWPAALALVAGAAWAACGRDRVLRAALAWVAFALAPFVLLFPYLFFSFVSDRYLYLAAA